MKKIILWGPSTSVWLAAARMVCSEKNIAYSFEKAPEPDHQWGPDHAARLMLLQAPALRDGGFCLFTGEAILRYLDDGFPGPSLLPIYARTRGLASEMLAIIREYVMESAIGALGLQRLLLPRFNVKPNDDICAQGLTVLKDALLVLEQLSYLAHDGERSEFLTGPDIALPDIALMPVFYYLNQVEEGKALIENSPRLARWWLEVEKRHSLRVVGEDLMFQTLAP